MEDIIKGNDNYLAKEMETPEDFDNYVEQLAEEELLVNASMHTDEDVSA